MTEMSPAFRKRFMIGLAICVVLELAVWMTRESSEAHASVMAAQPVGRVAHGPHVTTLAADSPGR
jgi:hypothetical protein